MRELGKERFSGIELLKLIAMLMIVISHSGPYYGDTYAASFVDLRMESTNIQNLLLMFYIYLGQIGNCMFLVCSAYFLLDKEEVRGRKIAYLLGDCLFFSLAFLVAFLCMGFDLSKVTIIKQFFPTTFEFNWYVGCYLLLYIIHPALNLIIRHLSKRQLLAASVAGIGLYSVLQMVVRDSFYYTRLVGFILIYFLMAYCKQYLQNTTAKKGLNRIVLSLSAVLLVGMILITNVLGFYLDTFHGKMLQYCIFANPFIILIAFSAFHLCKEWKFKSKGVNLLASVTLYIYIIHENYLFASYARPMYFAYIYETHSYAQVALWALALAAACYVASMVIGLVYKFTLEALVHRICDKLTAVMGRISGKVLNCLEKWN